MQAPARIVMFALAAALLLGGAAASQSVGGSHERACGAAFGVLHRCAAAGDTHEKVRSRCCGLLDIFQRNGCLCPDCPPGASASATSAQGLLLGAELTPLMDLCGVEPLPLLRTQPQQQPQQHVPAQQERRQPYDEDGAMSEMAGRAAWAHDPRSRLQHPQQQQQQPRQQKSEQGRLMDTPAFDYDNQLSDADTAFMLVDPQVAARYAARAANLAARLAADLTADVAEAQGAASQIGARVQARLAQLLAAPGTAAASRPFGNDRLEADEEAWASAGAVTDDDSEPQQPRHPAAVQLASAAMIPRTPEQRRAAALAAAMERQQARNLALRVEEQPSLPTVLLGHEAGSTGEGHEQRKVSVDITIDADDPEAARRMVGSITLLLRSWQAASGSASSQAELAAALERAAAHVAASAAKGGPLGRAGLQPKQLTVQQFEEEGRKHTCACMSVDTSALSEPAIDLSSAVYQRYLVARVSLCRFACQHDKSLAVLLAGELALCCAWLAVWLLHRSGVATGDLPEAEGEADDRKQGRQFLIATAADPRWQPELKRPLLGGASCSSSSSC
ncbi:hypothetical protein ACK3TF_004345 [Chlorella vulgaris]